MASKATGSELGMDKPPKPPKGYVVSNGVCDGEDYAPDPKPWMGSPDSEITGAEIGEPTNQPGNPWGPGVSGGPSGGNGDVMDRIDGSKDKMGKSSPSSMTGKHLHGGKAS
jgi:hypothetical protein